MSGRPTKMTKEVLEKLEVAFLDGHTDEEACLIAEINPSTLYTYCKNHKNFSSKKELLKQNTKMVARRNIVNKIHDGDVELSKWYLERKAKEEFSVKQEVANTIEVPRHEQLAQLSSNIQEILKKS